jgi:hypothetical protein
LTLLALSAGIVSAVWARAARENGREARRLAEAVLDALRKGHHYPNGTAVVTGASPVPQSPEQGPAPVPAPARAALPAEPAPASVARSAPHARPVKVASPASAVAPSTVPKASTDRKVRPWDRPFKPTAEQADAARAAHAGATEVEGDERATVEIPAVQVPAPREVRPAPPNVARALGARGTLLGVGVQAEAEEPSEDRDTDEGKTRVWSVGEVEATLVSEAPPGRDVGTDLSPDVLARVDALAEEQGVTRAEMLRRLARQGTAAEERRKADLDKGSGKG